MDGWGLKRIWEIRDCKCGGNSGKCKNKIMCKNIRMRRHEMQ
jgi:hypothetical protein